MPARILVHTLSSAVVRARTYWLGEMRAGAANAKIRMELCGQTCP